MDMLGKRICALDYGRVRIGVAVCDAMHIVVSTRSALVNEGDIINKIIERCNEDRIEALVIGMPFRKDNQESAMTREVQAFVNRLRERIDLPVFVSDESYSSVRASRVMLQSGVSKKRRRAKGTTDSFAAAIILDDVLEEIRVSVQIARARNDEEKPI